MLNVRRFVVVCLFSVFTPFACAFAQESEVAPPADDETLIYVIREGRFAGSMNKMWIAVNDQTVARVENDAYAIVRTKAGRITLNLATAGIVAGAIAVDDRPGETVYLHWRLGDVHMAELDATEALELLANLKRTPPVEELQPNNEQVQANYALDVLGLDLTHPTTDVVEPDVDYAVITIFRRDKKDRLKVAVWGTDAYIAALDVNQGFRIKVPAGEHTIFTGLIPDAWLHANVEAGKNYYAGIKIGLVKMEVVPVLPKDAKKLDKWLKKVEFVTVDPDGVTDRVREREKIVTDYLKGQFASHRAAGKKLQLMGGEHAF
jgi:hypothetical protein